MWEALKAREQRTETGARHVLSEGSLRAPGKARRAKRVARAGRGRPIQRVENGNATNNSCHANGSPRR